MDFSLTVKGNIRLVKNPPGAQGSAMSDAMRSKIETLMRERGFSARSLSRAAGLNDTAVRDILTRNRSVRMSSIEAIASVLMVDVAYLLSDTADLTTDEAEFVRLFRLAPPAKRALLKAMAEDFAADARARAKADDPSS